jgi:hypothetical protein
MAKTGQKSSKVEANNTILDVSSNVEDLVVELERNLRGAIGCVYVKADKMEKILKKYREMGEEIVRLNSPTYKVIPGVGVQENLDSELRAVKNSLNPPIKSIEDLAAEGITNLHNPNDI